MSKKLFDNAIAVIAALGTISALFDSHIDWICDKLVLFLGSHNISFINRQVIDFVVPILLFVLIYTLILYYKSKTTNLFDTLHGMSVNNKLHSLREMVMVVYERTNEEYNQFIVKNATFSYTLSKTSNGYDVEYVIDFSLSRSIKQIITRNYEFGFFIICENKSEPPDVGITWNFDKNLIPSPVVLEATIRGESGDEAKEFAGLFLVKICLENCLIKMRNNQLKVHYTVNDQIELDASQYSFVIIPQNYGKKLKKINAIIKMANVESNPSGVFSFVANPIIYGINKTGNLKIAGTFCHLQSTEKKSQPTTEDRCLAVSEETFKLTDSVRKADANSAYFIEFKLKSGSESTTTHTG